MLTIEDSAVMMDEVSRFTYIHSNLSYLLDEKRSFDPETKEFDQHILSVAFPRAKKYNDIMTDHQGKPVGVEFRRKDSESFAFVVPDNSGEGRYRVQMFDENGFSGHSTEENLEAAVEEMVNNGFRVLATGKLDELQETRKFQAGTQVASLIGKLNCGEISHLQFVQLRDALYA